MEFCDRELTKCTVLGIDMLLLLGPSQNGILCITHYTANIYCVCTCITVYTCTCGPAPAATCTPVSTYTFCTDLVTFSHFHRIFCSLHRSCNFFHIFIEFFAVCTEFDLCSGLVKHFLLRFSNGQTKEKIVQICNFSTFVQNL